MGACICDHALILRTMSQTPSFSKLDEVVVPTGTASGAQFCVTLPAKRHGQAVQQRFDLWQGSGCCPKVQPRDVEVNAGKRAEQRPSTRAGRGKCAADQIYECRLVVLGCVHCSCLAALQTGWAAHAAIRIGCTCCAVQRAAAQRCTARQPDWRRFPVEIAGERQPLHQNSVAVC